MPQSSLTSQDDQSSLCMEKFDNPPRTLYDEIGQQEQDFSSAAPPQHDEDWKSLVFRLQIENTSLVNSLHETNSNLMQSRREKEDLEEFIQRQTETTDKIVSRLKDTMTNLIENQKNIKLGDHYDQLIQEKDNQILDLIFQKQYLLMENEALKESQQEINEYYGILPREPTNPLFKLRSCVYALIAVQRFIRKNQE
ncbi:Transcription elongation factor spt6 [Mucor velutinosus]|uniref:Transcription elongation factor spt6 n=1 Tax=Mucor velutinosus TaxID=708070 RepID=A0AAN7HXN9_9FUNG|nr:Transcription elongation factor spt6 [Mucor velutinosus]